MISEKLLKKLDRIDEEFQKRGFFLKEDILELVSLREDVGSRIEETKFKKIEFFQDEELKTVGFTLEDMQVEFFVTTGVDEEGAWYEAEAKIILF